MEQKKVSKTFREYLPDCHRTYSCVHCRAHLANHDELISKSFQGWLRSPSDPNFAVKMFFISTGSQGRAYLFNSVVNVGCGPAEERVLLTGHYQVFSSHSCFDILTWPKLYIFLKTRNCTLRHFFVFYNLYQDFTLWLTSSVIAARQLWAGNTSMLLSPVRNTRRENSSSSWPTWSRKTVGKRSLEDTWF